MSTFGTVEKGFVDGPQYHRYTNTLDPIPRVIREAQRGINPSMLAKDPIGATPVNVFKYAPSFNPIDAHGMNETYIPKLNGFRGPAACC